MVGGALIVLLSVPLLQEMDRLTRAVNRRNPSRGGGVWFSRYYDVEA